MRDGFKLELRQASAFLLLFFISAAGAFGVAILLVKSVELSEAYSKLIFLIGTPILLMSLSVLLKDTRFGRLIFSSQDLKIDSSSSQLGDSKLSRLLGLYHGLAATAARYGLAAAVSFAVLWGLARTGINFGEWVVLMWLLLATAYGWIVQPRILTKTTVSRSIFYPHGSNVVADEEETRRIGRSG